MPFGVEDVFNDVNRNRQSIVEIPAQSPQLNTLAQNDDVMIGGPDGDTPLTDGNGLFWNATNRAWQNGPASGSSSNAFYADSSPAVTSVPSATTTNLDWQPLALGAALLDLSTINTPEIITAGVYAFDFVVGNNGATGVVFQTYIQASDAVASFITLSGSYFVGRATAFTIGFSLTTFLNAGSTLELKAIQGSGGALNVQFVSANVTKIT